MNTLRSILFILYLYLSMAVLGLLCLPSLLLPVGVALSCVRLYVRIMLFGLHRICGIKVIRRGEQLIPDGPVLIAGKHQSMLDVFIPFLMFKQPVIVMKRELLWYPFLGWYALKLRMLPIDRDGGTKTMKIMLDRAYKRVTVEQRQMLIFPEGTRQPPGAPPAYKRAGLRAFYKTLKIPVLPLATNSGTCWPARGIHRRPGTIVYEVLPAIAPDQPARKAVIQIETVLEAASDRLLMENPEADTDS